MMALPTPRSVNPWPRVAVAGVGLLASLLGGPSPAGAAAATVRPGGLVRWAGDATVTACLRGEERSAPLWHSCFFPIDLDTPAGPIEVARERAGTVERRTVAVGDYPYSTQQVTITDPAKVDPSATDLARIERDQAKMKAAFAARSERRFALPLAHPLASLPVSGRFGDRRIMNGQPRSPHTGADYRATTGTPIYAVADGTVVLAEDQFFPGNAVVIDHGDQLFSMSFHLSRIAVREGQSVRRGEPIGEVGATGRVSGPHLHFGVRWRGAKIDPELLLGRAAPTEVE